MRLLHTASLSFEEFFYEEAPPYAVLSHRWLPAEVSYHEFDGGKGPGGASVQKIKDACSVARSLGHAYIWIDTICIDKKSSAELSEAINAMFKWYKNSQACLVHLADVADPKSSTDRLDPSTSAAFAGSEWFTRGWTLQELIAPRNVIFFSKGWKKIGTKLELCDVIAQITSIDRPVLEDPSRINRVITARKMSWASRRKSTREEDMTYSLLGIFNVNMPLLYGEGAKRAFLRLQLEILKDSRDDSIFAWTRPDLPIAGMLAPSASAFADCGDLAAFGGPQHQFPWTWTNLGLELRLPHYGQLSSAELATSAEEEGNAVQLSSQPLFGRDLEVFTLGCWKTIDPDKARSKSDWHVSDGLVSIRLKRYGAHWRRIDCTRFLLGSQDKEEVGSQFFDVGRMYAKTAQPMSYRLLYVR